LIQNFQTILCGCSFSAVGHPVGNIPNRFQGSLVRHLGNFRSISTPPKFFFKMFLSYCCFHVLERSCF
jgi:hypothetical protein